MSNFNSFKIPLSKKVTDMIDELVKKGSVIDLFVVYDKLETHVYLSGKLADTYPHPPAMEKR